MGIEIDENGHLQRSIIKERKREQAIKKETRFHIIRINRDKDDFDIDNEISESGKKFAEESTKKSLIEDSEKMTKILKQLHQSQL